MNTLTTNTQTLSAINQTADEILEALDQAGFSSDVPVNLKPRLVEIITQNLLGNTNYAESPAQVPAGIPMDDLGYPRFIACESNRVKA